jgi:hypothetical protein
MIWGHFQVGVGESHLLLALFAADQAGGGQYRAVGLAHLVEQVVEVVGGLDLELDPRSSAKRFTSSYSKPVSPLRSWK